MYDELTRDSFAFRNLMIDLDEAKDKLSKESNEFEKRRLEVKIDELEFNKNTILRIGKDRFREIKLWSKLKKEFDDGSFDSTNVHEFDVQKEAHQIRLENRAVTLTNGSNQAEVLNVVGPLATMSEEHKHLLDPKEFKKLNKK